jgi:transcriptional regulator with XRE-family HTH domain
MADTVADVCVRQHLDLAGLTQRSGLEESRVAAILLGRWTPSPNERQQIAAALNVPVESISWGHRTPIQHLYGHGPG